jgi:hypothetical protein
MVLENAYITNCNLASQGAVVLKNAFLEGAGLMATRQEKVTAALTSKFRLAARQLLFEPQNS